MLDLNDAEPQRSSDLIPDGSFAKVVMAIRPGGIDGNTPMDAGLLKASTQPGSDVRMLDCEFTVTEGPHIRRKFWQALTVSGGKVDEKGVSMGWLITKRTIRGMIESALGLDPSDESPQAKAKRTLPALKALDGITFIAKIKVEPGRDGQSDQNRLDIAVTPDLPEWSKVMKGEDVPPRPGTRRAPKAAATPADTAPAWRAQAASPATPARNASPPRTAATGPANGNTGFAGAAPAWQQNQAAASHQAQQRSGPAWLNE
ncbi:hypothetical protein ACQR1I_19810 [Bradyrhizobium sp. HKCCYLS2038]|uniref:hypothetical protein n=1 Tax=Bradyrhizobium sp. HKCCYLS2038 TaxID=3420764 RepID=UPI003EB90D78